MRIQWSSEAAQEMLDRLKRAEQGLEDCRSHSAQVYRALDEANPDGGNKALVKARSQFDAHVQRLRRLTESLEDFISAIRRTDAMFEEAEKENGRLIDDDDQPPVNTVYSGRNRSEQYANWGPESFVAMPRIRLNSTVLPAWLEDVTNGYEEAPFIE